MYQGHTIASTIIDTDSITILADHRDLHNQHYGDATDHAITITISIRLAVMVAAT